MLRVERVIAGLPDGVDGLADAASAEGFGHVARLAADWADGSNRFDAPGEALFGAWLDDALVGIGGLNRDPFVEGDTGRVRRLHVLPSTRRRGVASALMDAIEGHARGHFGRLRLYTSNPDAAVFYESRGYRRSDGAGRVSHVLELG